jgi:ectoine hydroxylase-related dioxygenase (phytanoyl-CoA dioxygenase family)
MGPTEVICGSHAFSSTELSTVARQRLTGPSATVDRLTYKMVMEEGDVMVMDIRTQHRGTANLMDRPRTILYIQYVQDFFIDRGNFPVKQTRSWDALPSMAMRKLVSRIDHDEYVEMLEAKLVDGGLVDGEAGLAAGGSVIKCKSPLNVLKD